MSTKHKTWTIEIEGRTFNIAADREYRNPRPGYSKGYTYHTIYVWERFADGTGKSIVTPFMALRAPKQSAIDAIALYLTKTA